MCNKGYLIWSFAPITGGVSCSVRFRAEYCVSKMFAPPRGASCAVRSTESVAHLTRGDDRIFRAESSELSVALQVFQN